MPATTKVFRCALRLAAPPCAAAMVAARVSTLPQGLSRTPTFAALAASGLQCPLRSSPSPAGEATVTP
eukprot:1344881-Alexandrium_andersonii.AAC.1